MVPAQVFHSGMLANHVETKFLDQQEIVDHGLVGGRGVEAVRLVTLVENTVMVVGLAIQRHNFTSSTQKLRIPT